MCSSDLWLAGSTLTEGQRLVRVGPTGRNESAIAPDGIDGAGLGMADLADAGGDRYLEINRPVGPAYGADPRCAGDNVFPTVGGVRSSRLQ